MASDVPLISSYKKTFVYRRVCQTFCAGIRRRRQTGSASLLLSLAQVVVFFVPAAMSLPFTFMDGPWWWTGVNAILIFCYASAVQTTSRCFNAHSTSQIVTKVEDGHNGNKRIRAQIMICHRLKTGNEFSSLKCLNLQIRQVRKGEPNVTGTLKT